MNVLMLLFFFTKPIGTELYILPKKSLATLVVINRVSACLAMVRNGAIYHCEPEHTTQINNTIGLNAIPSRLMDNKIGGLGRLKTTGVALDYWEYSQGPGL